MFTIRRYGDTSALRTAAKALLTRSQGHVKIITHEPEEVRKLFTPEEMKRITVEATNG